MKRKVLYIEDEPNLGKIVLETLEKQGFDVVWEKDGGKVLAMFNGYVPHIVILDIMLPNTDGYTLCQTIRSRFPSLPIIFLTAKVETNDLLKGFECGGTDYMKKPFSMEELIARIHNQFQIIEGMNEKETPSCQQVQLSSSVFYPDKYELQTPAALHKLSQRDRQILDILVAYKNRVVERKELLMSVWGDDSFFNSRNLDVYIRKFRKIFEADPAITIQTLKGKGYLFLIEDRG